MASPMPELAPVTTACRMPTSARLEVHRAQQCACARDLARNETLRFVDAFGDRLEHLVLEPLGDFRVAHGLTHQCADALADLGRGALRRPDAVPRFEFVA